jgi:hypothetical protein
MTNTHLLSLQVAILLVVSSWYAGLPAVPTVIVVISAVTIHQFYLYSGGIDDE